jgi:hypothetical protein
MDSEYTCLHCGKEIDDNGHEWYTIVSVTKDTPTGPQSYLEEEPSCDGSPTGFHEQAVYFPNIHVQLTGHDGNAFAILGRVKGALNKARIDKIEVDAFLEDAMSGDYDHLLYTCSRWVNVS